MRNEDELRGRVQLVEKVVTPGEMGGVLETVTVLVTSGTASALVTSVFSWLSRTKEARIVSLKFRTPAGRELDLTCGSADDALTVVDRIRLFFDGEK